MAKLVLPNGRGHGWKPDTPDHRDFRFSARGGPVEVAPKGSLDLAFVPPTRDQGQLGSCTGYGTTGALMWCLRKRAKHGYDSRLWLSALYAYYQGRVIEASVAEDSGCEIRDVVKALVKIGVSLEKYWPYVPKKFAKPPVKRADRSAKSHQIARYYRCDGIDDIRRALASGLPVVGGFSCFHSLGGAEVDRTGVVPLPQGPGDGLEGGHCVWFFGWDDERQLLTFQNSWGAWGHGGNGYLPYGYVEQGLADDFWAIEHE